MQPQRQRKTSTALFDGVLADRHTTEDGSEYIHLILNRGREPAAVLDVEFLFLSGKHGSLIWKFMSFSVCYSPSYSAGLIGTS